MLMFFCRKKYGIFLPQWWQICVTCFSCLLVINICLVLLCINEKNIYGFQIVLDEAPQWLSFQSLGECWFYCGHWFRSTSSLSCRALVLTWICFFSSSFLFIGVCFRFIPWRWKRGGDFVSAMWFCLKIMSLVFWIEDMGSLDMTLLC